MGKLFDKGLSSGVIDIKALPTSFSTNGKLYRYLIMEMADEFGTILDNDPDIVLFIRSILYLYKKIEIDCPPLRIKDAVDAFVAIEDSLYEPQGSWHSDVWIPHRFLFRESSELLDCHPRGNRLWEIADKVFTAITPNTELCIADIVPRHGPGAVSDLKRGGDKYSFPHWPEKLGSVFSPWEFAFHSEEYSSRSPDVGLNQSEPPARLIAVPKTYSGPRLIASEPTAHQFLQQGLMRWIRRHMNPTLRTSIDFNSQQPSRDAALLASESGKFATVDLSSASDRLSCWVVERAFGSNQTLLRALHAARTRYIVDGTGMDPDLSIRIKKFAAQGSAVTFPVQSIIYLGMCLTALAFVDNVDITRRGSLLRLAGKVRVFGDDIVIPTHAVPVLYAMLDSLQLKINVDKTHISGRFRESCGMDAFRGYDVTPCYLTSWAYRQSPTTHQSWIDVSNNAFRKGFWNLASWMDQQIPCKSRKLSIVTSAEGDGARFFTFCKGYLTNSRTRYNKDLQRDEILTLVSISSVSKRKRGTWQDFYQYLVEAPLPDSKWEAGYPVKTSDRLVKKWVAV